MSFYENFYERSMRDAIEKEDRRIMNSIYEDSEERGYSYDEDDYYDDTDDFDCD